MPDEKGFTTTTRRRRMMLSGAARPAAFAAVAAALSAALLAASGGGAAACAAQLASTPRHAVGAAKTAAATAAACDGAAYRAFDFWLGSWEVRGPRGRVVGASRITPALHGCAVEERWRVAAGTGGRSLNAFDRRDGRWHQLWVDVGANVLRLAGELRDGAMVMLDARPAGDSTPPHDRITWTPLGGGRVRQQWDTAAGPVAAAARDSAPWRTTFSGVYEPTRDSVVLQSPTPTAAAPAATPAAPCKAANGPYRALDFLRGEWEVRLGRRDGPVAGRRAVVTDLNDCLTVGADFDAAGTYRGISYAAYDARAARWVRESVDDEGRRVVLVGEPPAGPGAAVVMREVREGAAAATVSIDPLSRVVWRALPDGDVSERWDRSTDGGATWRYARELLLRPRRP